MIFGCHKKDELEFLEDEYFYATVNDEEEFIVYRISDTDISSEVRRSEDNTPRLEIRGYNRDNEHQEVRFYIKNYKGSGIYNIPDDVEAFVYFHKTGYLRYDSESGRIHVTEDNGEYISGTFTFSATHFPDLVRNYTGGEFKVKIDYVEINY
tara:strand:+ start:23827 stop:24282 length:456 start_codon:yes stop_codon:yes gene_type:complete